MLPRSLIVRLLCPAIACLTLAAAGTAGALGLDHDRRYGAELNEAEWTLQRDGAACHLLHPVPRFGLAVFSRTADGTQTLRIYTHRPPQETRTVELWSEATEWHGSGVRRVGYTRAMDDLETFRLNHALANRVLQELERGRRAVLTFEDWHNPRETAALAVANAGFRPAYQRYLGCTSDLEPGITSLGSREPAGAPDRIAAAGEGAVTIGPLDADALSAVPPPPGNDILARYGQAGPVEPPPVQDTADPARVYFVHDDTGLTRTERDRLDAFVRELDDNHGTISVTGHADSTGETDYNRALGRARAEAVRDYLVDAGVDADRITTATAGEDSPAADNDSDYGRAVNRRVRLRVE